MDVTINKKIDTRIEFRVTPEDRELYDYAKNILGFTSLSDYVRHILSKESKSIVEENNRILASEKDKQIFFKALMGEEELPNKALLEAVKFYQEKSKNNLESSSI